jgi:protein MpaA
VVLLGVAGVLTVVVIAAVGLELTEASATPSGSSSTSGHPARSSLSSGVVGSPSSVRSHVVHRTITIGRSVQGRPIEASEVGDPASTTLLVMGCIHGNEPAGIPVARDLREDSPPTGLDLWVVPDLNPDGKAGGTRQNARGVDLNRNFPWHWRPIGSPGVWDYSGTRALSEPESRAAHRLIIKIQPQVTIWFHQDEDLVDKSGGDVAIERRYARLVRLPLRRLPRYPGSAASWQNHELPRTTAFVVELPPGALSSRGVERFADAVVELLPPTR